MNNDIVQKCKHCGSSRYVVKFGKYKNLQRWWCNQCQRKFTNTNKLPKMKTLTIYIALALNMYYDGMSLNSIRWHFLQQYGYKPSESTLYNWLMQFSKSALKEYNKVKIEAGDIWIASETSLKIDGGKMWIWDLMDYKNHFLLSTHMSMSRTTNDAKILLTKGVNKVNKPPKVVITNKLAAYIDAIELVFGADTKHLQVKKAGTSQSIDIVKRVRNMLENRKKVMRKLRKLSTAVLLLDGWSIHYNFFISDLTMGAITPAEKAGVMFPASLRLAHPSKSLSICE